jgi:gamma-glutamyl phosphate reductase
MIDYSQILARKYKDSEWTLNGDDYAGLTWLSETTKPTKKELDDLWSEVQKDIASAKLEQASAKEALLKRLGLTEQELQTILG